LIPGQGWAETESGTETGKVFILVRQTDYAGVTIYTSSTPDEFSALANAAKRDNAALPTAYANLRKEWRKTMSTVEKRTVTSGGKSQQVDVKVPAPPFPLNCPEPRVVKQMGKYATAEALEKAKEPLEEKEAKQVSRLAREKEDREAMAESRADALANAVLDTSGLKRPPPKPPTKRKKRVSLVSEEEMLNNLVMEIERIKMENEAVGSGGLRGTPAVSSMNATAGAGGKAGAKTGVMKIKRMGE
jgi:hypothetical protein